MRKRRIWWIGPPLLMLCASLQAQEVEFSQYRLAPLSLNPAEVAASPDWRAIAHYRRQQMAGDVGFRSTQFSVMRPLYSGQRRYAGVGISVLDDRSAGPGWFRFQRVGLSVAYNVPLAPRQYLSLGLQTRFQSKRITLEDVRTGSQFHPGPGFDPALRNGEGANGLQTSYFSVDAGGLWYAVDRHERTVAYAGLSLSQLNRPRDPFFAPVDPLPVGVNAYGGWLLYDQGRSSVVPELLWRFQGGQHRLNVGARLAYRLGERYADAKTASRLEIIPRYTLNRNASLAVQWHQGDYTLGVSFDTDASFNASENPLRSAFELVVAWHPPVRPKNKKKCRRKKKLKEVPVTVSRGIPRVTPQPVSDFYRPVVFRKEIVPAAVPLSSQGALAVQSLTLVVEFAFNQAALDPAGEVALRDIVIFLKQQPELTVTLTGHADGVGTHAANEQIAWERARVVQEYLLWQGIAKERVKTEGRGAEEPLYPAFPEVLRAKNRRVEIGFSSR